MSSPMRRRGIIICAFLILLYVLLDRTPSEEIYIVFRVLLGLSILATTITQIGHIIQWLTKTTLGSFRRVSLGIAASYIIFPLALYGTYKVTGKIYHIEPLLLCAGILVFSAIIERQERNSGKKERKKDLQIFWYTSAIFIIIVASLVVSYQPLPDLDPYGWIQTLQPQFEQQTLPPLTERPFFASFVYICTQLFRIDIFTFFKYIFPFLSLTILPALWIIAEKIQKTSYKLLFMLYVLAIPSTALYLTTQTPQAILIITSIYAVVFLLISATEKSSMYFFIAGILLGASFLYHQAAAIIFLVWILGCIIAYRKQLFGHWKNITITALTVLVLRDQVQTISNFLWYWIKATSIKLFSPDNTNLLYPAQYVNIDNNQMGWPGISGIVKFYGYYASPITILILGVSLLILCSRNKKGLLSFFSKKEYGVTIGALGIFLSIAEVLPRFPNIALLPERAWIFVSIFTIPLLFFITQIRQSKKQEQIFITLALVALIIGISGTLYVNSLKRFLITPEQLVSAEWIKKNLPDHKMIYGYGNGNLIIFHAKSSYKDFGKNILCSNISLQELYDEFTDIAKNRKLIAETANTAIDIRDTSDAFLREAEEENSSKNPNFATIAKNPLLPHMRLLMERLPSLTPGIVDPLAKEKGIPTTVLNEPITVPEDTPQFVYFAPKDERNPYNDRGYHPEHWGTTNCKNGKFVFDMYPEAFQRVYEQHGIIIWKMIKQHEG